LDRHRSDFICSWITIFRCGRSRQRGCMTNNNVCPSQYCEEGGQWHAMAYAGTCSDDSAFTFIADSPDRLWNGGKRHRGAQQLLALRGAIDR
jgi:hypothetical protein